MVRRKEKGRNGPRTQTRWRLRTNFQSDSLRIPWQNNISDGPVTKTFITWPERRDEFLLSSISQNEKECNNPRQGNHSSRHFFQEINWGAPLPSIASSEIITRLMFFRAGTSYIKSSMTSSRIERNPLAPVFIDEALVAMA